MSQDLSDLNSKIDGFKYLVIRSKIKIGFKKIKKGEENYACSYNLIPTRTNEQYNNGNALAKECMFSSMLVHHAQENNQATPCISY